MREVWSQVDKQLINLLYNQVRIQFKNQIDISTSSLIQSKVTTVGGQIDDELKRTLQDGRIGIVVNKIHYYSPK